MPYDIHLQRVQAQPIAVVRRRAKLDELSKVVPEACGEVWNFIRATNLPHTGLNLALYFDDEMNIECGVIVKGTFIPSGNVICSATPVGTVATTAHIGPYHLLGNAHEAIHQWCKQQGHKLVRPCWEIYDHWTDDASKLRTDVFYLLAPDAQPSRS